MSSNLEKYVLRLKNVVEETLSIYKGVSSPEINIEV